VKRVEFVSYRLSYIVLRGRWHNIIVVNVLAPSEEKSNESKDSFCEDLSRCSITSRNIIWKCYEETLIQKWGERIRGINNTNNSKYRCPRASQDIYYKTGCLNQNSFPEPQNQSRLQEFPFINHETSQPFSQNPVTWSLFQSDKFSRHLYTLILSILPWLSQLVCFVQIFWTKIWNMHFFCIWSCFTLLFHIQFLFEFGFPKRIWTSEWATTSQQHHGSHRILNPVIYRLKTGDPH